MSKLQEKMKMDLELKGYSLSTQTAYLRHVKNFAITQIGMTIFL